MEVNRNLKITKQLSGVHFRRQPSCELNTPTFELSKTCPGKPWDSTLAQAVKGHVRSIQPAPPAHVERQIRLRTAIITRRICDPAPSALSYPRRQIPASREVCPSVCRTLLTLNPSRGLSDSGFLDDGSLESCLLRSARDSRSSGYFAIDRWVVMMELRGWTFGLRSPRLFGVPR